MKNVTFLGHEVSRPSYVPMTAWLRHGPFAMWLVRAARPKTIVELGSHYGYSYFAFCQAVKETGQRTRCIAVDTWRGDEHSGLYGEEVFDAVCAVNRPYAAFSRLIRKTFFEALDDVEDGTVDLLHIDGRHFYDDVKEDYENWIPKLSDHAVILFHDTEVRDREFGVWRYWKELAEANPTFNFRYQHGLGVLFRGDDLSPEMAAFRSLVQDEAGRDAVNSLFLAQGNALAADHTLDELALNAAASPAALSELLKLLDSGQLVPESQLCALAEGSRRITQSLLDQGVRQLEIRAEYAGLKDVLVQERSEKAALSTHIAELSETVLQYQAQALKLHSEIGALTVELQQERSEHGASSAHLAEMSETILQYKAQALNFKSEICALTEELQQKRAEHAALLVQVANLSKTIFQYQSQTLDLQVENRRLLDAQAECGALEEEIEQEHLKQAALSAHINHLSENVSRYQARTLDLEAENRNLRIFLAQARAHPGQVWKQRAIYLVLRKLITSRLPISEKARSRFSRSAQKRDPHRSIVGMPSADGQSTKAIAAPMPTTAATAKVMQGRQPQDPARGNVLLVSHEASYTGAPVLVHNVARVLSDRYNVTVLCIRGGDLLDALLDVSVDVVVAGRHPEPGTSISRFLKRFLSAKKLEFAVVNSIESRRALPILNEIDVTSVSLIHEFASYTRPHTAFSEVIDHADDIVFSSPLTLANAVDVTGLEVTPNVHVFPQGKCVVPSAAEVQTADYSERQRLRAHLRPAGHEDDFLVIGAGHVQIRKGSDLFIEVARQALADSKGRRLRFAWIGAGYDPEHDLAYSVYLQDQLKRSGLAEELLFLPPTSEIEYAYELTDLLLLPSRLDPLPNVAIDAMLAGVPVLCFDSATGIAEVLRQGGLATECVADYLNTADMVSKLRALVASDKYYADVARRTKAHAQASFDMEAYVCRIEKLAITSSTRKRSRTTDAATIAASPLFRANYVLSPGSRAESDQTVAEYYLDVLSKKSLPRRPEPGFNPHVYARHRIADSEGGLSVDPYADFLRKGRPAGPWSLPVICESNDASLTLAASDLRCALHIHAYYPDALGELLTHLQPNKSRPALYVSVANEKGASEARAAVDGYDGDCTIRILPNAGRDIGPFLTGFGAELVNGYDIVGHVHTKKSIALADDRLVRNWTSFLQENTLGGSTGGAMLDRVLNAFAADDRLGVVFPADPHLMSWSRNRDPAARLAEQLGLGALPDSFDFPVGTMFWMRSTALRPFVELKLDWADYPREPVAYDGTVLHALERLFGVAPVLQGHRIAVTCVAGLTR